MRRRKQHRQLWLEVLLLHRPGNGAGDAADAACAADRRRFELNPGLLEFQRPFMEGEFPPELDTGDVVAIRVVKITEGVRVRVPIFRDGSSSDHPASLAALHAALDPKVRARTLH